jgi:integrase
LRISDLLTLQINHFIDGNGKVKKRFWIMEQKRGKRHEIAINQSIQETLMEYIEAYPHVLENPKGFLFFNYKTGKPIKRGQVWKFITSICKEVGLRGNWSYPGMVGT